MSYSDYASSKLKKKLEKKLADRRQEILETLGSGADISDMSRYRHWTGYLKALSDVLAMMTTAEEEIRKEQ